MSKFDEVMDTMKGEVKSLRLKISDELLTGVAKGLGPSIYNVDSSKVSSSDKAELDRVKANFLIKKCGLTDGPALDDAIKGVVDTFGAGNRNKYRIIFYALLAQKMGKEAMFIKK